MKLAPLPAVYFVLLSTATAHAGCAWLLWEQWGQSWIFVDATESHADCERGRRNMTQLLISAGAQTAPSGPGGKLESRLYFCMPDTIDPRGPKGR
jgi:hypothetical protein